MRKSDDVEVSMEFSTVNIKSAALVLLTAEKLVYIKGVSKTQVRK